MRLSTDDCDSLLEGRHPANREVSGLFSDPHVTYVLAANAYSERFDTPTGRLADAVAKFALDAHPNARFLRDPMDAGTHRRIADVSRFDEGRELNVRAIIPDARDGVVDGKLLQNIRDELSELGVSIATSSAPGRRSTTAEVPAPQQAVIVISGHSSPSWRASSIRWGGRNSKTQSCSSSPAAHPSPAAWPTK